MSVLAVTSGKGSPGATFVAVNLAAALTRAGQEVLLLDLDPSGGDICCYLALDPRRGLYPLLRMEGGVPEPDRLLAEAEERAGFLAVCGFPEPSDLASPDVLLDILQAARGVDGTVVADLGRASAAVAPVAAEADRVALVVRPDLVSVLGAERALRRFEASVPRDRVGAVISGLERRRPGDRSEVADALRLPVIGTVPLDPRGARRSLLAQAPAQTRRLRRAFDDLAAAISAWPTADSPQPSAAQPLEVRT